MAVDFDPYSHRYQQDPFPVYRRLRDEAPVHYAESSRCYTVARYDDVLHVLNHPERFCSKTDRQRRAFTSQPPLRRIVSIVRTMHTLKAPPWEFGRSRMLIREDGDVHQVMRKIVNKGFTPRRIASWEARVAELADEGLARVRAKPEFDLVEELAIPLPVTVISELLGVDSARQHDFKRWSDAIIKGGTGTGLEGFGSELLDAMGELRRFLIPVVAERKRRPESDLISLLVTSRGDAGLSDFEIFLFVLLLLIAGNETTTNLLGNAVDALLEHPDQLERVRRDPALIPGLIEETLRFDSPVQMLSRKAVETTRLHDVEIPKGSEVVALLGAANRDERRFDAPDRFDVLRDTRGHVGFGFGAHFCLGAALARLEAKAALEVLIPELATLERARAEREFLDSYVVRGRSRLDLRRAA